MQSLVDQLQDFYTAVSGGRVPDVLSQGEWEKALDKNCYDYYTMHTHAVRCEQQDLALSSLTEEHIRDLRKLEDSIKSRVEGKWIGNTAVKSLKLATGDCSTLPTDVNILRSISSAVPFRSLTHAPNVMGFILVVPLFDEEDVFKKVFLLKTLVCLFIIRC